MDQLHDQHLFKQSSYINGKWHHGDSQFDVINPATEEVLAKVTNASIADAELAVKAAKSALKAWSSKSANERAMLLRNWFNLMM